MKYSSLVKSIEQILWQGRKQSYAIVDSILIKTYWSIGRNIVEYQQGGEEKARFGASLLEHLSKDLSKRFGKGFSRDNLENMRKFYLLFRISETLSRKLSWSHYRILIRINNSLARNFYLKESEQEKWSVRELDRQVNSGLFERIALSKDKKKVLELSKTGQIIKDAKDIVKDPYILEFLNLENIESFSETDLEKSLLENLKEFLSGSIYDNGSKTISETVSRKS